MASKSFTVLQTGPGQEEEQLPHTESPQKQQTGKTLENRQSWFTLSGTDIFHYIIQAIKL